MQDMLVLSSMMNSLLDTILTSRADLLLFVVGLLGYIILCSSRNAAKQIHHKKEVDDCTLEQLQVTESPPVQLERVLESMVYCDDVDIQSVTAEMHAFLEEYPNHLFAVHEVQSILRFCGRSGADAALADTLLEHMKTTEEWHVLSAFISFYLEDKQTEKACDVFELNYATFFDIELDEHMEWQLLMAASQCGRQSLAEHLLQTSQTDIAQRVSTIQRWWKRSAARMGEARVTQMGAVLNRLSNMFNERYPFEEHSDDESTCFLGDDSDCDDNSEPDCSWDASYVY